MTDAQRRRLNHPHFVATYQSLVRRNRRGRLVWRGVHRKDQQRYAVFQYGPDFEKHGYLAGHIAWEHRYGEPPAGMAIWHQCRRSSCVDPKCMFLAPRGSGKLIGTLKKNGHLDKCVRNGRLYRRPVGPVPKKGEKVTRWVKTGIDKPERLDVRKHPKPIQVPDKPADVMSQSEYNQLMTSSRVSFEDRGRMQRYEDFWREYHAARKAS